MRMARTLARRVRRRAAPPSRSCPRTRNDSTARIVVSERSSCTSSGTSASNARGVSLRERGAEQKCFPTTREARALAVDVEPVGIGEHALVAVGRSQEHAHAHAFRARRAAGCPGSPCGTPPAPADGRSAGPLRRGPVCGWVRGDLVQLCGVLEQRVGEVADEGSWSSRFRPRAAARNGSPRECRAAPRRPAG